MSANKSKLSPKNNRLLYNDLLLPPEGYELDFCISTTYSLDMQALLCMFLALSGKNDLSDKVINNPLVQIKSIKEIAQKIAIFVEGGQIKVPANELNIYSLVEKSINEVKLNKPTNSQRYPSFHPKFHLIKYKNKDGQYIYRLIVLSRNLTFDNSWDVAFSFDGIKTNDKQTNKTESIIDFCQFLKKYLSNYSVIDKFDSLINDLEYVKFDLNAHPVFYDFEFIPLGIYQSFNLDKIDKKHPLAPLFLNTTNEVFVMSPFLSDDILQKFVFKNLHKLEIQSYHLITRKESLCKIYNKDKETNPFLDNTYVLRDDVCIDDDNSNRDIHAKIYMVNKISQYVSYIYIGSANATHNAFYNNVEVLIRLASTPPFLNTKLIEEDLFLTNENLENPFDKVDFSNLIEDKYDKEDIKNDLENTLKEVIRSNVSGEVLPTNNDCYDIKISFDSISTNFELFLAPLNTNKVYEIKNEIIFHDLKLFQLTELFRISVKDNINNEIIERVIKIPLKNMPANRDSMVVSNIIDDQNKFNQFISLYLDDNNLLSIIESPTVTNKNSNNTANYNYFSDNYEKMLKILVTNKERLFELQNNIKDIDKKVIPEDFLNILNLFIKVAKSND